jgi:hypothetical protein
VLTSAMDASLKWCSTPPLWHTKAVGGRLPHQNLPLPDLYKSAIAVLWLAEDSSVIAG